MSAGGLRSRKISCQPFGHEAPRSGRLGADLARRFYFPKQQRRAKQCAVKGRLIGQFLLWTAVAIVLVMILFPQQIAGFLADHFYRS